MSKIVSCRIPVAQLPSQSPLPLLAKKDGLSPDESGNYVLDIECEDFYIIPKNFQNHRILKILTSRGLFSFEQEQNKVPLPVSQVSAYIVNMSPYADVPVDTYSDGLLRLLDDADSKLSEENENNAESLDKLQSYVRFLQNAMREGLGTCKLYAAVPYVPEDWAALQAADCSIVN